MELKPILDKGKKIVSSYRYVLLILFVGLFLMLLPTGKKETKKESITLTSQTHPNIESQLAAALRKIDGVGEVHLLLTVDHSGETVYQTDNDISSGESNRSDRSETVIITDADRNQAGLVKRNTEPIYRGAVVICQGGENPKVQLAVTQAVMKSTGLSADEICVLKMK